MAFEQHVIVDAANILHAWPEYRVLLKRDRQAARSQLVQRLSALHDAEQRRLTVVVDGRGEGMVIEHPSESVTFAVVYTPSSLTADDVIEQMIGRSANPSACEVATGDQAERGTVEAAGAVWLSPADLLARLERAEARLARQVAGINRNNAKAWRK